MDTFMNKQGDKYEVGEMGRDFGGLKKKKKKQGSNGISFVFQDSSSGSGLLMDRPGSREVHWKDAAVIQVRKQYDSSKRGGEEIQI